jgi:large subunit ribosomal protein L28
MAQICELTGKKPLTGNNVSNSNIKIKRRQNPNLHSKKMMIPELKKSVTLKLSTNAIRTIDKLGISGAILKANEEVLSKQLRRIARELRK